MNEHANGNGRTATKILATVPERLIKALPAGFVAIIVLNVLFMGGLTYAVNANTDARNAMLTKIVDKCLEQKH